MTFSFVRHIPESRLKDCMRIIKHKVTREHIRLGYSLRRDAFKLKFDGPLYQYSLFYPYKYGKTKLSYYSVLTFDNDLLGYFQYGLPEKESYVIHGGAWPGDLAVLTSQIVGPEGKVFAFEPNPELRGYIRRMLNANNARDNIEIHEYGLWDIAGETKFFLDDDQSAIESAHSYSESQTIDRINIKTTTIDHFVEENDLDDRPIFIVLDIEGAEIEAMKRSKKDISSREHTFCYSIISY